MDKNKILVITGMHRSGTSLITQWLHKCGLHVGDELLGADTGNENGHFEDLDFLNSHKAILKGRRFSDNGFTAPPIRQLTCEENDRLKDIIVFKNGFNQQWGWKDPRTCLFLDVYHELIPAAFYFVVYRDYTSVISSLIHRMYKQSEKKYAVKKGLPGFIWKYFVKKNRMEALRKKYCQRYLKMWIQYNEAILAHIERLPEQHYIVTDYRILYKDDKLVFDHLANTWGFELQFFSFKNIYKEGQLSKAFVIDDYIKDKTLLIRALHIEESLKQLDLDSNIKQTLIAV